MTASTNGRRAPGRPRTAPFNGYPPAANAGVAGQTRAWRTGAAQQDPAAEADAEAPDSAPAPRRRPTRWQWFGLAMLAVVLTVLGAGAGYGATRLMPTTYAAHADINYRVTREQPTGFLREDRNVSTQLVLLKSRAVLQPVAQQWDMNIDQLTAAITPSVTQASEIIRVDLTDRDPQRARQLLDAVVQRYLTLSNDQERNNVEGYLNNQLDDVLSRENRLLADGGNHQSEMGPLVNREQFLREQLDQAHLTDLTGPGAVLLVPAYVDAAPVSPRPVVTTAAGAAAGLVVALLAVAFVARRMTRR